jgi:hypothetical protein
MVRRAGRRETISRLCRTDDLGGSSPSITHNLASFSRFAIPATRATKTSGLPRVRGLVIFALLPWLDISLHADRYDGENG